MGNALGNDDYYDNGNYGYNNGRPIKPPPNHPPANQYDRINAMLEQYRQRELMRYRMGQKKRALMRKRQLKKQRKDGKIIKKHIKRGQKVKKQKRKPNGFIAFFLETYKRDGGDRCDLARECGKKWRAMSEEEKEKYQRDPKSRDDDKMSKGEKQEVITLQTGDEV